MEKFQLIASMWVVLGSWGATFYGMFAYLEVHDKRSFPLRFVLSVGTYVVYLAMGPIATIKTFCPSLRW